MAQVDEANAGLQRQVQAAQSVKNATAFALPPSIQTRSMTSEPGVITAAPTWTFRPATAEEARARKGENVDANYAALYRKLGLTENQKEQFRNLMLDREESSGRLFKSAVAAARAKNPKMDRAVQQEIFEATNAQLKAEQQAEVRRVFGDVVGQTLENYQAVTPVRSIANQLATALFNSDSPVTPVQVDQIIDVLAQNARGPIGQVELPSLNSETAVAQLQAQGLLNPSQVVELQRIITRAKEQAKTERERNTAPVSAVKTSG